MKRIRALGSYLMLFGLGVGACAGDARCEDTATASATGHPSGSLLGLSAAQRGAIVAVHAPGGTEPNLCSGSAVGTRAVLTAWHCVRWAEPGDVEVVAEDAAGAQVIAIERHPELDLALLELDDAALADVEPLRVSASLSPMVMAGTSVEIGGYGGPGGPERVRTLVEQVEEVTATHVRVRSLGSAGPCGGDSGGPLLVRAEDGIVEVAGTLSSGSVTCRGVDDYVRVDMVGEWLTNLAAPVDASDECGQSTGEGRCHGVLATWCDDGRITAERCAGPDACGWSDTDLGYRCIDPDADPCDGIDGLGRCEDGAAVRCEGGTLTRVDCGACDKTCALDATSGRATCR